MTDRYAARIKLLGFPVKYRRIHFKETRAAEDRASLRRIEGNGRALTASSTIYGHLDPLLHPRSLSCGNGRKTLILRLLALFAAFRRILKLLVAEKRLFAGGPDKVRPAVDTKDRFVVKVCFG